jgi:hypothetical protein
MKWEYGTVKFPASGGFLGGRIDTALFNAMLNERGEHGWELVNAFATSQGYGWSREIVAIFKREKR